MAVHQEAGALPRPAQWPEGKCLAPPWAQHCGDFASEVLKMLKGQMFVEMYQKNSMLQNDAKC